jgi:hypothetical protein
MRIPVRLLGLMALFLAWLPAPGRAEPPPTFSADEVLTAGHSFFGTITRNLAAAVERVFAEHGRPNGYVLGEEGSGAFFGGLRYGEGVLHTKNAGDQRVFWQGPSLGLDFGADGTRTMILVYDLPTTDALFQRFVSASGQAFLVGGVGVSFLAAESIKAVPIRSGVGARLGANIGYLKFSQAPTWNPF